jgi:hypothetical protein
MTLSVSTIYCDISFTMCLCIMKLYIYAGGSDFILAHYVFKVAGANIYKRTIFDCDGDGEVLIRVHIPTVVFAYWYISLITSSSCSRQNSIQCLSLFIVYVLDLHVVICSSTQLSGYQVLFFIFLK